MPSRKRAQGQARRRARAKKEEEELKAWLEEHIAMAIEQERRRRQTICYKLGKWFKRLLFGDMPIETSSGCKHGRWFASSEWLICEEFLEMFKIKYEESEKDPTVSVNSFVAARNATHERYAGVWENVTRLALIVSFYCGVGAQLILEGEKKQARSCAVMAYVFGKFAATMKKSKGGEEVEIIIPNSKLYELNNADEHTLVEYFWMRTPCSCLRPKFEQVKSTVKTGICAAIHCPLPDNGRIECTSMICCTRCAEESYCSEECQVAHWHKHKILCDKIAEQKAAFKSK